MSTLKEHLKLLKDNTLKMQDSMAKTAAADKQKEAEEQKLKLESKQRFNENKRAISPKLEAMIRERKELEKDFAKEWVVTHGLNQDSGQNGAGLALVWSNLRYVTDTASATLASAASTVATTAASAAAMISSSLPVSASPIDSDKKNGTQNNSAK